MKEPLKKDLFIACVLSACMYVHLCMPGVQRGQNRVSDTQELELQMLVNQHVGVGN